MESSAKIREWMNSLSEFLNDQVWYQELRTKWEELDPQSRLYLQFASIGFILLCLLIFTISQIWKVHSLKNELLERRNLLTTLQSANEEARNLREILPPGALQTASGATTDGPWTHYFEGIAESSGIDKASVSITGEKPGASTDQFKENLFDITLKHMNIKQIVRYAYALENGQRPVKLRNVSIDTKSDPSGFMDATLAISAFVPITAK